MVEESLLVPLDDYLASGVHIGTKFKTKAMARFIYKTNPNGLAVLNVSKIDERLRTAANFLSKYEPKDILLVCKRENGWNATEAFAKLTGVKFYKGRYPAGILTNTQLETFIEPKVLVVVDPWLDKNAIQDALKANIPILALCDTNNTTNNIDVCVPLNNKGVKSIGLAMYVFAREYLKAKGIKAKVNKEDFVEAE
jgi:small subunit ribosomal protein S2